MLLSSIFPCSAYVCSLPQGLAHIGTRDPKPRIWAYPMANRVMESSQLGNKQWRKSKRRQNDKVEIWSALTSHTPPLLTPSTFRHCITLILPPSKKKATELNQCVVFYNLNEARQRKQHRAKARRD